MTAAVDPIHLVRERPQRPTPTTRKAAVPDLIPSSAPHPSRKIAATLVLGAPAAAAIWGSATALTAIGVEDRVASPWTLPFCLDVLALGMVVVALLVPGRSLIRRATPWVCYLFSAGLQVWEAWDLGPRAWGTHAAGLIAAAVGSHVILDLWAPEPASVPAPVDVVAEPVVATPDPVAVPEILAEPVQLRRPTPARKPRASRPTPAATAAPDLELVDRLRVAIDKDERLVGIALADVNREQALNALRATPEGGVHVSKVGPALRYLKENPL